MHDRYNQKSFKLMESDYGKCRRLINFIFLTHVTKFVDLFVCISHWIEV